jgi:hypothetical protein
MKYQLEFPYELPIYQVILIHKDGSIEKTLPSRMIREFAEEMAKNTIESEESLVDFKLVVLTEKEADEYL